MAITGRFEADFQSFYAAVDKADAKLADFQSGAGRVESSLNRMVDSFSGRRLIQEATISAEAIERIGGVSKLTEAELQKVAEKATQAVEKMKAMGVAVPPGLQAVAANLKPVETGIGSIVDKLKDFGKEIIAGFTVEKIAEFALNIGKSEQELTRLSDQTQISTNDIQDITAATEEYGLSNEELAKALFTVSKGIAGGDESVARGLHEAGLTLDELKDKHGKELFLEIEKGLSTLQGSLRDTAAADIFGKLGGSMAGFAKDAEGAIRKAEQFNEKLSPEEIANLKKYADEVEHLERTLNTLKDKALGQAAEAINATSKAIQNGVSIITIAKAALVAAITGGTPQLDVFAKIIEGETAIKNAQKDIVDSSKEETQELSKEAQAAQFLSKLRTDAAKELEPYQKQGLEDLRAMGQLNSQNAAAIGVSVDQFKKYSEAVRVAELSTKALTDATIANKAQVDKLASSVEQTKTKQHGTQTQIELGDIKDREDAEEQALQRRASELRVSLAAQHADTKENLDKIDADTKASSDKIHGYFDSLRDGVGVDWDEIRAHSQQSLNDIRDRALKTLIEARATPGISHEEIQKLTDDYRQKAFAATRAGQAAADAAKVETKAVGETSRALVEQLDKEMELKKIADEKLRFANDITAANFDTAFSAPAGLAKGSILALLKQGFSIQNAVDILYAQQRGIGLDLSKWPVEARGPRVPGFKYGVEDFSGGDAIVGEDGPEYVKLPGGASVLPLRGPRSSRGGGQPIAAQVFVSGVFDPSSSHAMASVVGRGIMQSVANSRILR